MSRSKLNERMARGGPVLFGIMPSVLALALAVLVLATLHPPGAAAALSDDTAAIHPPLDTSRVHHNAPRRMLLEVGRCKLVVVESAPKVQRLRPCTAS